MLHRDFSLYLITDRRLAGGRPIADVVREAVAGGVRAVQLREKDLSSADLYRLAADLRGITADSGARLIINDRLDIALAVDADGIHLGISGMPVTEARRILGPGKIIIYSAHAVEEAKQAWRDGADFVTFGPVYPTQSKASYGAPCGIKKLAEAVNSLEIPVIALGGISRENVEDVCSADVAGIAVISAVVAAGDPRGAATELLKKIEAYAKHS